MSKRRGTRVAAVITSLVLAAALLGCDGRQASRLADFEKAVKLYVSGDLSDERGVVQLTEPLADATVDSRMYVTSGSKWGDLYLFITWRGKGSNLRGYVYCDSGESSLAIPDGTIKMIAPIIRGQGRQAGNVEVEIEKMSTPGWYKVSRSLD